MRTHLRLHREQPDEHQSDAPVTYQFPTAMAAARKSLVAARVNVPAIPEQLTRSDRPDVLARFDRRRDRTSSTEDLVREVEKTLKGMQSRVDRLRHDADDAFKFPAPVDDGPRAA